MGVSPPSSSSLPEPIIARRKVLRSFSGAETAASEADEAVGLTPDNEENEAGYCFSPEKPCLPLSTEGIIPSFPRPVQSPAAPGNPVGWSADRQGAKEAWRLSTPIFFLAPQKENGGGAVKRKNAFRCAVTGAERPAAQRDAALNGPAQLPQPLREHGRGFAETSKPSTPCCTAQSSGKT